MSLFLSRPKPEEVFTPRAPAVNADMYVHRPHLERSLVRALDGGKNIVVTGESGSGKTWLYKKTFAEKSVLYEAINLSSASLKGSLEAAFKDKNDRLAEEIATERTRSGAVKALPFGVGAEGGGAKKYSIGQKGAFETLLSRIREKAGPKQRAILVYENFEQVIDNNDMLRSVADTLILLDDDDLSQYAVKICIVGVPTEIKQILVGASANVNTIANRITEVAEVARLSKLEAASLMAKGFQEKLKIMLTVDADEFYAKISWKTDRIAQHIHEYCLIMSQYAADNHWTIDEPLIEIAENEWLTQTLSADYSTIEQNMNARRTTVGRKNQALYSLGCCDKESFRYADIEDVIRAEFPQSSSEVTLNIAQILADLAAADRPILRRSRHEKEYRFVSPKYRMCLRTMLKKTDGEKVEKIAQRELS